MENCRCVCEIRGIKFIGTLHWGAILVVERIVESSGNVLTVPSGLKFYAPTYLAEEFEKLLLAGATITINSTTWYELNE